MRDPERIDRILEILGEVWKQRPDWRLGQLIVNANKSAGRGNDAFFIEDDDLEEVFIKMLDAPGAGFV